MRKSFKKSKEEPKDKDENKKDDNNENKDEKNKKKVAKVRQNPLLAVKTDNYVDDSELYVPRISNDDRIAHWQHILNKPDNRNIFTSMMNMNNHAHTEEEEEDLRDSWVGKEIEEINPFTKYPAFYTKMFFIFHSNRWDQIYINCLILWLAFVVLLVDGWAKQMSLDILITSIIVYPIFGMLACSLLPMIAAVYFVHYCHDLVYEAAAEDFANWAFSFVLTAQCIEYFYYGGRDRRGDSGKLLNKAGEERRSVFKTMVNCLLSPYNLYIAVTRGQITSDAKISPTEEGQHDDSQSEDTADVENQINVDNNDNKDTANNSNTADDANNTNPPAAEDEANATDKDDFVPRRLNSVTNFYNYQESEESVATADDPNYIQWTCLVCDEDNPLQLKQKDSLPVQDIFFGMKGTYYKRLFAKFVAQRNVAICKKCFTPYNYDPNLGTVHIFSRHGNRHQAFKKYPPKYRIYYGADRMSKAARRWNAVLSLFNGLQNHPDSLYLENDWRMKKFLQDIFPVIPRYNLRKLPPNEVAEQEAIIKDVLRRSISSHSKKTDRILTITVGSNYEKFEPGEVVECCYMKSAYERCKVHKVRMNNTYDIKYDGGEELRFVPSNMIRCRPEKRTFAYYVEIGLMLLHFFLPIGLLMCTTSKSIGSVFIGPMIVGVGLFVIRMMLFVQYSYNFIHAGLFVIFRATMLFTLPILFMFLLGAVGLVVADTPGGMYVVTVLLCLTLFFSLPVLYVIRPAYVTLAMVIYPQLVIGTILVSIYQGSPATFMNSAVIPTIPWLLLALTMKYIRAYLHTLWDVCFIVRPATDLTKTNPSLSILLRRFFKKLCS